MLPLQSHSKTTPFPGGREGNHPRGGLRVRGGPLPLGQALKSAPARPTPLTRSSFTSLPFQL